jgi:large subunit ribosomal protein L27e
VTKALLKKNAAKAGEAKEAADANIKHRLRVKPFVKFVNFTHLMPTRYNLDVSEELSKLVTEEALSSAENKKALKGEFKTKLEQR